jgi:hypothetical protein
MIASFLEHFSDLEDPRFSGFVTYPLPEILVAALVGVVCGAEDCDEIVLFCEEKMDVLRQCLPYKNGVASAKTFWRVFDFLNSPSFADRFAAWVAALIGSVKGVVAIVLRQVRDEGQNDARGAAAGRKRESPACPFGLCP